MLKKLDRAMVIALSLKNDKVLLCAFLQICDETICCFVCNKNKDCIEANCSLACVPCDYDLAEALGFDMTDQRRGRLARTIPPLEVI